MSLADNLRRAREKRKMSQIGLAKAAGVYQNTIRAIEIGLTKETKKIDQIARALGVTVEELLQDEQRTSGVDVLSEGHLVDIERVSNPNVANVLRAATHNKRAEIWQLSTDLLDGAGYLRGDYVVVDLRAHPQPGNIVLAIKRHKDTEVPLFRALFPPNLMLVTQRSWPTHVRVETVDDRTVMVRGVVTVKIR